MNWLLWKDYRVNRVVFITAAVLLIGPHLLAAILMWRGVEMPPRGPLAYFEGSSLFSLVALQLVFALLGGNSIAGERNDRSAEFLAYMPVSRGRSLSSKLLVSLAAFPLVWLPNLAVLRVVAYYAGDHSIVLFDDEFFLALVNTAITGLIFFCVSWLFSCLLQSPTFSVFAGLLAPAFVCFGIQWVCYLLNLKDLPQSNVRIDVAAVGSGYISQIVIFRWYWGLCLLISAASFAAGTVYYLRRVEP